MRISDWSSDVCSFDLDEGAAVESLRALVGLRIADPGVAGNAHPEHIGLELGHEPAAIGLFGDRALLALLEHRGTAIEVDQRGAGVEVGHDPGIGVARRLARLAEFENLRDVAGDRPAVRPRRAGEGRAIAAVAAIADGVAIELADEADRKSAG